MAAVHISDSEKRRVRYAARLIALFFWGGVSWWSMQSCAQLPTLITTGGSSALAYASVMPLPRPKKQGPAPTPEVKQAARQLTPEEIEAEKERKLIEAIRVMRSSPFDAIIVSAAHREGLDPDLVRAVIYRESRFNHEAVSPKGARGLMQIMPGTADDLGVKNPHNARQNIYGGTRYLRERIEQFDGDLILALAAYNAGPDNVRYCMCVPEKNRDGSLNTETPAYVRNVLGVYQELKKRPEVAIAQ